MRFISVWRRSPTARFLDVQLDENSNIAVFSTLPLPGEYPVIDEESELIAYVSGNDTDTRWVDADLAHRVLGWDIPE